MKFKGFYNSLQAQLLFIFSAMVLSVYFLIFTFFNSSEKIDEFNRMAKQIDIISNGIKESGNLEKDFLYYETVNPDFFITGFSSYNDSINRLSKNIIRAIDELSENKIMDDYALTDDFNALKYNITQHGTYFNLLSNFILQRGWKDWGLNGEMRQLIHRIENSGYNFNLVSLLTIRRYEKDYMLRKQDIYIGLHKEAVSNFIVEINKLNVSKDVRKDILATLQQYTDIFNRITQLDKEIGFATGHGMKHTLDKNSKTIIGLTNSLNSAFHEKTQFFKDRIRQYALTVSVVIGLLNLFLIYIVIVRFSRPISKLAKAINKISFSNFDKPLDIKVHKQSKELVQLVDNINGLIRKFHDTTNEVLEHRNEIMSQNIQLEQAFEEIRATNDHLRDLNKTKDKLFSIIGHDLRSPIGNISSYLTYAMNYLDRNSYEKLKVVLRHLKASADNSFSLLENLFDWSKNQISEIKYVPEFLNVGAILPSCAFLYESLANDKNITIHNLVADDVIVFADANMLKTVFRNLIANAVKFTHAGGNVYINAERDGDFVTFSIVDTGVGIAPDRLDSIFDFSSAESTYGTAGEKGTGLGLILCADFIQTCRGRIWVESKLSVGTTFYFKLPVSNLPVKVEERETEANNSFSNYILIIDEKMTFEYPFKSVLDDYSAKIVVAKSWNDAVSHLETNKKIRLAFVNISVFTCDVSVEVKKLKSVNPALPIIMYSGIDVIEEPGKAYIAGCDMYISKPYKRSDLDDIYEKYLKTDVFTYSNN